MTKLSVNLDRLMENKLTLNEYFVLYCVYIQDKTLITSYVKFCNKIDTGTFNSLEAKGFIIIDKSFETFGKVYFELLSLTEEGKNIVLSVSDSSCNSGLGCSDEKSGVATTPKSVGNFEEFRTFYPSRVMRGSVVLRRLHSNLKKCKATYEKLLLETTHDILCKCAKAYHNEKRRSNSEEYMQNLETWLNQRNYLQYLDEVKGLENTDNQEEGGSNLDAI